MDNAGDSGRRVANRPASNPDADRVMRGDVEAVPRRAGCTAVGSSSTIYELLETITDRCEDAANGILPKASCSKTPDRAPVMDHVNIGLGSSFSSSAGAGVDFMNGFHDAANAIATVVSTRVLKPHTAVLLATFFNFVAIFVFELQSCRHGRQGQPSIRW